VDIEILLFRLSTYNPDSLGLPNRIAKAAVAMMYFPSLSLTSKILSVLTLFFLGYVIL
jgi:hypothetical protein